MIEVVVKHSEDQEFVAVIASEVCIVIHLPKESIVFRLKEINDFNEAILVISFDLGELQGYQFSMNSGSLCAGIFSSVL
jgi:hypothetical protein